MVFKKFHMNTIQFKNHPNANTTLVFRLNCSNSIQIPKFKYQIIRSPLVQIIQKLPTQSRNCPDNPETVRTIRKQSGQSRNFPDNPETEFCNQLITLNSSTFSLKSLKILDFAIYALYPLHDKSCYPEFFLLTLISLTELQQTLE